MSQTYEVNYLLNLQMGDMKYNDLRKIEMSFVKIGNIVQRVFPDSPIAQIMEDMNRTINLAREAQMAIRAVQMASGPIGWLYAGVSIASASLTVYESTIGSY